MDVAFTSDNQRTYRGFTLDVESILCREEFFGIFYKISIPKILILFLKKREMTKL